MLNQKTGTTHYYRIHTDSTVVVRPGKTADAEAELTLSVSGLTFIADRAKRQLLPPDHREGLIDIGYDDHRLLIRVSQQFDVYLLGLLLLMTVVGGTSLGWLLWRLSREKRRRSLMAQSRRALAEGREKERERLAREIHDGPVQALHGLHMGIETDVQEHEAGTKLGDELMRVTEELRALSANLHPPALKRFGLFKALRSHVDRLQDRHSVSFHTDLDEACPRLSDQEALPVFRVAQEALHNAVQHSDAERIEFTLRCTEDVLRLTVCDDGDGFTVPNDQSAFAEEECYGLLGMQERADALGADLGIESEQGSGTTVRLLCPISDRSFDSDSIPLGTSGDGRSGDGR